ncbi:Signal transducer regulating beta-lactamase production, contains metallopeptidase domain [Chitinophaga sp. CF118]|uniref:M56 family metallopeptidase n=1 Tax=Chitinophaga sp. CF118 TaxID=1884367 RepID=UPI0008EA6C06|nr:M56 family metallopeptidase [Chitinophaga sp. CF118]SFE87915.1 Signal transducer regulating beta-lactamase production, contains metallopeptidase domain [Chitinophaga sp. CF118]
MTAQIPFTADLIQAFGWALLHSFWQALLVYACLRLVLMIWPQASASIKYNLSFISLTGIFSWFIITLWQQLQTIQQIHQAAQQMIDTGVRQTALELPAIYHSQQELTGAFPGLEVLFPLLTVVYVAGVASMTIKLVMDLLHLRQIRRKQVLPIDPVWEKHLDKLMLQLQLSKKVKLLISEHIQVPVMIGFLKPLIILPVIMFNNLTAEQLEAILLHELAHIKRNDYLLNIFQSIVETILFFNPFIWLISKSIRIEREHCCDDLVIAGKVQPLNYAKALVALEEYRLTVNALAMAAADNKQHLFHRIKRIMEMKTKNINYTQKLLAVLIIAVGLISIAWLNPSGAKAEGTVPPAKITVTAPIAPGIVARPIHFARYISDTVPTEKQNAEKQDAEKKAVEEKQMEANHEMDAANAQMDAAKAGMEAAKLAMEKIDWKQMNADVTSAMKNVDWDKINKDVQTAMKNIDWKKINEDIKAGMQEAKTAVDPKVIEESVRIGMESAKAAMANFNVEEIKKNIANAKEVMNSEEYKQAMANVKQEIAKAQKEIVNAQSQSRVTVNSNSNSITSTTTSTSTSNNNKNKTTNTSSDKDFKLLIEQMTADKLIDPKAGYTISKKNGVLTVNGVVQSSAVEKKYSKLLKNVKGLSIIGKEDNLTINISED